MKLAEWMHREGLTIAELAALIGVNYSTAHRYLNEKRRPHGADMERIITATDEMVLPNDWYADHIAQPVPRQATKRNKPAPRA